MATQGELLVFFARRVHGYIFCSSAVCENQTLRKIKLPLEVRLNNQAYYENCDTIFYLLSS